MNRLKEKYIKEVVPLLKEKFSFKNNLAVPKLEKVVINTGIGKKQDPKLLETAERTLTRITGQKPVRTKAKKSISGFKVREGMIVGLKVTLRGPRMYDFIDKLVNITLPRVHDFRGLNTKALDGKGNLNIGFKEHVAFPEVSPEEIERLHGLEVCVATTAKNNEEGLELLKLLGFPFKE